MSSFFFLIQETVNVLLQSSQAFNYPFVLKIDVLSKLRRNEKTLKFCRPHQATASPVPELSFLPAPHIGAEPGQAKRESLFSPARVQPLYVGREERRVWDWTKLLHTNG